jgi:hypothetical protein
MTKRTREKEEGSHIPAAPKNYRNFAAGKEGNATLVECTCGRFLVPSSLRKHVKTEQHQLDSRLLRMRLPPGFSPSSSSSSLALEKTNTVADQMMGSVAGGNEAIEVMETGNEQEEEPEDVPDLMEEDLEQLEVRAECEDSSTNLLEDPLPRPLPSTFPTLEKVAHLPPGSEIDDTKKNQQVDPEELDKLMNSITRRLATVCTYYRLSDGAVTELLSIMQDLQQQTPPEHQVPLPRNSDQLMKVRQALFHQVVSMSWVVLVLPRDLTSSKASLSHNDCWEERVLPATVVGVERSVRRKAP